jgi:hypothetical protein
MIGGRFGVMKTHAGPAGDWFPASSNVNVKGRYRDIKAARREADRLHGMVVDLADGGNTIIYWSPGAQQAFATGRAGPVGRMLNRADRVVDQLESKTHGRGVGYRANRGGGW